MSKLRLEIPISDKEGDLNSLVRDLDCIQIQDPKNSSTSHKLFAPINFREAKPTIRLNPEVEHLLSENGIELDLTLILMGDNINRGKNNLALVRLLVNLLQQTDAERGFKVRAIIGNRDITAERLGKELSVRNEILRRGVTASWDRTKTSLRRYVLQQLFTLSDTDFLQFCSDVIQHYGISDKDGFAGKFVLSRKDYKDAFVQNRQDAINTHLASTEYDAFIEFAISDQQHPEWFVKWQYIHTMGAPKAFELYKDEICQIVGQQLSDRETVKYLVALSSDPARLNPDDYLPAFRSYLGIFFTYNSLAEMAVLLTGDTGEHTLYTHGGLPRDMALLRADDGREYKTIQAYVQAQNQHLAKIREEYQATTAPLHKLLNSPYQQIALSTGFQFLDSRNSLTQPAPESMITAPQPLSPAEFGIVAPDTTYKMQELCVKLLGCGHNPVKVANNVLHMGIESGKVLPLPESHDNILALSPPSICILAVDTGRTANGGDPNAADTRAGTTSVSMVFPDANAIWCIGQLANESNNGNNAIGEQYGFYVPIDPNKPVYILRGMPIGIVATGVGFMEGEQQIVAFCNKQGYVKAQNPAPGSFYYRSEFNSDGLNDHLADPGVDDRSAIPLLLFLRHVINNLPIDRTLQDLLKPFFQEHVQFLQTFNDHVIAYNDGDSWGHIPLQYNSAGGSGTRLQSVLATANLSEANLVTDIFKANQILISLKERLSQPKFHDKQSIQTFRQILALLENQVNHWNLVWSASQEQFCLRMPVDSHDMHIPPINQLTFELLLRLYEVNFGHDRVFSLSKLFGEWIFLKSTLHERVEEAIATMRAQSATSPSLGTGERSRTSWSEFRQRQELASLQNQLFWSSASSEEEASDANDPEARRDQLKTVVFGKRPTGSEAM